MKILAALMFFLVSLSSFAAEPTAMKLYDGSKYRYSIQYPSDWNVYDRDDGVVVFKKVGGKSGYLSVNIQTIFTKKSSKGNYSTVKDLMDDFTTEAPKHADNAIFLDRKPIELTEPDGTILSGEEATMIFSDHDVTLKQWQIMVMTKDGTLFQAWAFRAPEAAFNENLPTAKKMLDTWIIR